MENNQQKYVCPRCHYGTNIKLRFLDHIRRTVPCLPVFSEESLAPLIEELTEGQPQTPFLCTFPGCNKYYWHAPSLSRHRATHNNEREDNNGDADNASGEDETEDAVSSSSEDDDEEDRPTGSGKSRKGRVYAITSPMMSAVKIGFWRSKLKELKSRYKPVYDVIDMCEYTSCDCLLVEMVFGKMFEKNKLYPKRELYDKKYIEYYKFVIKNLCMLKIDDLKELADCCMAKTSIDAIDVMNGYMARSIDKK